MIFDLFIYVILSKLTSTISKGNELHDFEVKREKADERRKFKILFTYFFNDA